jgi:hypothetical protein
MSSNVAKPRRLGLSLAHSSQPLLHWSHTSRALRLLRLTSPNHPGLHPCITGTYAAIATMRRVCEVCGTVFAPSVVGAARPVSDPSCGVCGKAIVACTIAPDGPLALEPSDWLLLLEPALDLLQALKSAISRVAHFICWLG